ncbi:type VI secretion system protein TssL, long form [Thalassococcus sp. S3]|uniref:type VI secretion system protein TssL, long form n=1 Tax=Thalassococcus sp. S3 TaxID=2017482 RepID=UPI0010247C19|nr:type VI secretion system protein TssL, long form [Thalassococcus sp. S3]QBF32480.1 cell envelope biogenesis protein OmpA [Thalassococcus sp. S3]
MSNGSADRQDDETPRIVLPTPGGKRREPQPEAAPAPPPEPAAPDPALSVADILSGFRFETGDLPVMVAQAAPLLNLAHALRQAREGASMGDLRRELTKAARDYEKALATAGILPDQARAAHYVVCATLDDVIRNTSWGAEWSVEGLVSTFHQDVLGGEKVYDLLSHFQKTPRANRDLLLLIYLCLSLGFEGRARVSPRGATELAQVRENLYRTLRTEFDIVERDLSPLWQGEDAVMKPMRRGLIFWLVTGAVLLLLIVLFVIFTLALNRSADATLARLGALPPGEAPSLFVPEPPAPPEPVVEPEPPAEEPNAPAAPPEPPAIEMFIAFLQPEVEEGLVRLYREENAVLVRVANAGAFNPGGAQINAEFVDIFDRIGQALAAEDFEVTVLGHTDNLPISSAPYPSNFHLSTARAAAVRDILLGYVEPQRISIQGVAETQPIATNATPEGREANRRTEILVREVGDRVPPELLSRGGFDPATEDAQ